MLFQTMDVQKQTFKMADQSLQDLLHSSLNKVTEEFATPASTEELLVYLSYILPLK